MRWLAAVALLLGAGLAGCTSGAEGPAAAGEAVLLESALRLDPASALNPSFSQGLDGPAALPAIAPPATDGQAPAVLRPGQMLEWSGTCPCPTYRFVLGGVSRAWGGWMEARVRWNGTEVPGLGLSVSGPSGSAVGQRGFDDRLARLWTPRPGDHSVQLDGTGAFTATVRLGSLDVPADGDLRPNLVELVIEGPHVGDCDEVERTEQGAVKCMRFGNGVGNPGHGPVQIRLTVQQAAMALAPMDGHFVQEVRQADGSVHQHDVGPARFHLAHGHWHYDGLAVFTLYAVDPETGLRGAVAASHGKSGFCFLDWDQMLENVTEPAQRERAETDCLVPGLTALASQEVDDASHVATWTNGISRGWYDFYGAYLSDQYVDVAGLPDGTYELVASADPLGTLKELDETDNQSSLLLELRGDTVDVLEERGHFHVQDDDDA